MPFAKGRLLLAFGLLLLVPVALATAADPAFVGKLALIADPEVAKEGDDSPGSLVGDVLQDDRFTHGRGAIFRADRAACQAFRSSRDRTKQAAPPT